MTISQLRDSNGSTWSRLKLPLQSSTLAVVRQLLDLRVETAESRLSPSKNAVSSACRSSYR